MTAQQPAVSALELAVLACMLFDTAQLFLKSSHAIDHWIYSLIRHESQGMWDQAGRH